MKFLVVEDHALTREGVRLALSTLGDNVTVLDVGNVDAARAAIRANADLDLVLLDAMLPGADGFSLLQELRDEQNTVPVVIISAEHKRDRVLEALDLGALGFISKSASVEVMLHAVRLVLAGGTYIPRQALATPRSRGKSTPKDGRVLNDLTERQRQILSLMACGLPNKLIASELRISEATVKSHVTDILRILHVTNRTQAVIAAGDLGIA